MNKAKSWTMLVVLALLSFPLRAEVIQLKNGNKINGKVTAINGDTFVVKTDYGDMQVPRSDIVSISFSDAPPPTADAKPPAPPVDEALIDGIYVNRTGKFQATLPPGWTISTGVRTAAPGALAALASPDQTQYFMVTDEAYNGSVNAYELLVEVQTKSTLADYERLEESQSVVDGKTTTRIVFHGTPKSLSGTTLKFLVYIVPYQGHMIRLTFWTLEPLFDDAQPVFLKIASSYTSLPAK